MVDASPTVVAGAMLDVVVGTVSVGAVVALVEDRSLVVDVISSVVSTVVVVIIDSFVVSGSIVVSGSVVVVNRSIFSSWL